MCRYAQSAVDACHELVYVERLGQVVVSSPMQPLFDIRDTPVAGNHDHERRGQPRRGSDDTQDVIAVETWHAYIEKDHLGSELIQSGYRALGLRSVTLDPDGLKGRPEKLAHIRLVVDDQYHVGVTNPTSSRHRCPYGWAPRAEV